ncbi:phage tail length tape measure family protein [Cupriavidus sp. KK10]|jgi:phage-related minor tail protein|uniref:phage tail length tape measure family protein n=1 Tax=Cupriavidus sp. KK10 TaxID=1478019 RepID=UPI001BA49252|nr:phage tail length tape measure family protein [Cupriavidus sp. KK10]QUN28703.1 phage tail length tape measure family protein [Cupriavidus sp. KK10]
MSLGSLIIELQANVARLDTDMGAAESVVANRVKRIESQIAQISRAVEAGGAANASQFADRMRNAEVAFGRVGVSAAQAANAMRMVPAQMTDIVTQLAGGQNPLLVLTQQGGQLKDMFGGIGPAIKGVGTYIAALLTPVNLAIAAVGGLAFAMYKGHAEAEAFSKSLLLTGNYAGMTADSFNDMSKRVAESTQSTVGASREAIQALVSTGAFTRQQMSAAAEGIIAYARVSGEKVEDVAKDYAKMTDGVAKWAAEHNRSMHYMTAATYDRIKALEDAGRTEQALMLNLEALHNRFADVSKEKLGVIERMWLGVKAAISGTWEAMKAIGRPETTGDRIEALERQRAAAQRRFDTAGTNATVWTRENEQELANLREMQRLENSQASRQASIARQQSAAIKAADDLEKLRVQFDKSYAKQKEITKLQQDFSALAVANPNSPMLKGVKVSGSEETGFKFSGGAYDKALAGINDRFKDTKAAGIDKANLDAQLRPIEDAIKREDDLLKQRERMLANHYRADMISSADYYQGQRNAIEEHIAKVRANYEQEIALTQQYAQRAGDAKTRIDATTKAKELEDRMNRAIAESLSKLNELTPQQARDTEAYRIEVEKLNSELAKLQGRLGENAAATFDRAHARLSQQAFLRGDDKTAADIDRARQLTIAQGELNEQKALAQQVIDRLNIAQDGYAVRAQTGAMNEMEALARTSVARQNAARELGAIADKMTEIAMQSGDPKMLQFAQQFDIQVKQLEASADVLSTKLSEAFSGGFATMLTDMVNHTKSLKDAVNDFAGSITRTLTQLAANAFAKQLFQTKGADGSDSWIGTAVSFISKMWGGGMADGGDVRPGHFYEVAENGPELLNVANRTFLIAGQQGGTVVPMQAGGGGGRQSIFNMHINVPPGTTRQSAQQQAAAIMRHASISQARNT